ncbi:nucleotidyltransferase domain-containing protein [Proteus terrae]|uniref:nucleotidyltransferase domain-containing protein n=1 Tax=Proteus terrae TaxID=1574161 RepID=UPI0021BBAFFD|nr:nucleotidyltransferase domain-containing protein [Proteus terrae]MCT8262761.1 nucleotidyltransferase domain-containing protein [Proteus terrae]
MVFSQVNKISLPPTTGFQTLFQPVITDVAEHLSQLLKENLHSIYVYGSVANGCAIAEKSDLDICLILKNKIDKFENQQLDKTRVMLGTLHPIVSKIDFDIGVLSKVLAPNNLYSWGYWLKHHCRCIFGDDLTQHFSPFAPSRKIALAINGDFVQVVEGYIKQIYQKDLLIEKRHIQRAIARKLIRSVNILRSEKDEYWPETLEDYVKILEDNYSEQHKNINYLLSESINPSDDIEVFIHKAKLFMHWLEIECLKKDKEDIA